MTSIERRETIQTESDLAPLVTNPDSLARIPNTAQLRIGFGVKGEIPLRVITYPVLAYELANRSSNVDHILFYTAPEFSGLFGIPEDIAAENASKILILLKLSEQTFVEERKPNQISALIVPGSPATLSSVQIDAISYLTDIIQGDYELRAWADERGGRRSLEYVAAHSLYMGDPLPIPESSFIVPLSRSRKTVMIGGKGEQITWRARRLIFEEFGLTPEQFPTQIFTTIGNRPPYFRVQDEPEIGDQLTVESLLEASPEIYRDYAAFLAFIARLKGENISYDQVFGSKTAQVKKRVQFLKTPSVQSALEDLNSFSKDALSVLDSV